MSSSNGVQRRLCRAPFCQSQVAASDQRLALAGAGAFSWLPERRRLRRERKRLGPATKGTSFGVFASVKPYLIEERVQDIRSPERLATEGSRISTVSPAPHQPSHALICASCGHSGSSAFVRLSDRLRTGLRQGHEHLLDGPYERLQVPVIDIAGSPFRPVWRGSSGERATRTTGAIAFFSGAVLRSNLRAQPAIRTGHAWRPAPDCAWAYCSPRGLSSPRVAEAAHAGNRDALRPGCPGV